MAGYGTRLRPHTWSVPKPLVPLAGKAMIDHIFDRLLPLKPEEIICIVGYLGDQIEGACAAPLCGSDAFCRAARDARPGRRYCPYPRPG
ncbi:MAG: sugar phosphate nucleotidyltransferase [Thermomicrobiales bacterium]